jgi:predicted nucleic acid-binding protein
MIRVYLDSSAYVKAFQREKGSSLVKRLFETAEKTNSVKIFLSYWVINESVSVIDRTQRQRTRPQRKRMTNKRKETIIATILKKIIDYSESNIAVVPLNHKFVRDSVNYIHKYNISADDALHIYVAYRSRCKYFVCKDDYLKQQTDNKIDNLRVLDITNKKEIDHLLGHICRS